MPRLEQIWQKYRDRGFTIVAVERKRDTERATRLIADDRLTYTFLEDGDGDAEVIRKVFRVRWFPTSYLIDRTGRVIYAHIGFEKGDEAKLSAEIDKLLAS